MAIPIKVFKRAAIVVLGGALIKKAAGWRTTSFNDKGDRFGIVGDNLRVLAARAIFCCLKDRYKKVFVIASGGIGQYRDSDTPPISAIIKNELTDAGIPRDVILEENNSNNTYEQLKRSAAILRKRNIKESLIVSNRYHLPRIKAFIEADAVLKKMYGRNLKVVSAEEILITLDPKKWGSFIAKAYNSKEMKKRIASERKGAKQIKNGTYSFEMSKGNK